jgi:hypothetical protein
MSQKGHGLLPSPPAKTLLLVEGAFDEKGIFAGHMGVAPGRFDGGMAKQVLDV